MAPRRDAALRRSLAWPLLLALLVVPAGAAANPPVAGDFARRYRALEDPQLAPDYAFQEGDGRDWGFIEFRGKVVIATFWATWCSVCAREIPKLDRLQARLADQGLVVIALSQDRGAPEKVQRYFEERGIRNLRVFHDRESVLGTLLGIRGVPTSFVIDREGRMVGVVQGGAPWESPEAAALLGRYLGSEVEQTTAPAPAP